MKMTVKMSDEVRTLLIKLVYRLYEQWENYIYEDEELNLAVKLIEGVLMVEDHRTNQVYAIFFDDDGDAIEKANELADRYENDKNMDIEAFIETFAEKILTFYIEPHVFKVYRLKR